jgi:hypothetical protein
VVVRIGRGECGTGREVWMEVVEEEKEVVGILLISVGERRGGKF